MTRGGRGLGRMAPHFLVSFSPFTILGPPGHWKQSNFPDSLRYWKRLFPLTIVKHGANFLLWIMRIWTMESCSKRKKNSPFSFSCGELRGTACSVCSWKVTELSRTLDILYLYLCFMKKESLLYLVNFIQLNFSKISKGWFQNNSSDVSDSWESILLEQ